MGGQDTRRCTPHEINSIRVDAPAQVSSELMDTEGGDDEIIVPRPAAPQLEIGAKIEGRLRILRLLGRGGMSEVYEAYDEEARRTVAVKLLLTERCADAQLAIFAEARALVRFRHPNVVGFFGVGAIAAQPFIELESASRGSLADVVETRGALPLHEALDLIARVASGLEALHEAGTVHRDVKADNVLLTEDGRPVIADFGLALHEEDLPAAPSGIIGTPAYMAPEAILGTTRTFEQYALADQYSLAILGYYLITGAMPFDAPSPSALFYAQMALEPPPPSTHRGDIPAGLEAALLRALAKQPHERYATLREFREALERQRALLGPASEEPARTSRVRPATDPHAPALKPTIVAA